MKKAAVTGILLVFGLFLTLFWMQRDFATSDVSLAHLTAKTTQDPTVYQPLEPETLTSLGIQAVKATEHGSLFASATFLYTLLFLIIIIGASRLYYKEAKEQETAWIAFQKSLEEKE